MIGSIQNTSGHGIDLVTRDCSGKLNFVEVKTSAGTDAPGLSDAQKNSATFIDSRLNRAQTQWQRVHNPNLTAQAKALQDEKNTNGYNTMLIEVTEGNSTVKEKPW